MCEYRSAALSRQTIYRLFFSAWSALFSCKLSSPLLRNRGIFRVFSPALDFGKNGDFQTGARRTTPSSYDALHIIIPGVAHIPEEIVLQDAVGFLENGLALCTQDESVNR